MSPFSNKFEQYLKFDVLILLLVTLAKDVPSMHDNGWGPLNFSPFCLMVVGISNILDGNWGNRQKREEENSLVCLNTATIVFKRKKVKGIQILIKKKIESLDGLVTC